ncbi:unnamed protein product [Calicophoron daubneyi]|uniref:Noggin n=1 Tax=Calicophoron daubneyi TaxID=300641 RepID=A0AAV2T2Q4_CALDB
MDNKHLRALPVAVVVLDTASVEELSHQVDSCYKFVLTAKSLETSLCANSPLEVSINVTGMIKQNTVNTHGAEVQTFTKQVLSNSEKANISKHLWNLFQQQNHPTRPEASILYGSPAAVTDYQNSNTSTPGFSQMGHKNDALAYDHWPQNKPRLKNRNSFQMLRPTFHPEFPINMPQILNERPFRSQVILTPESMLRLLNARNYQSEFMAYVKPWEAVLHPAGHLALEKRLHDNPLLWNRLYPRGTRLSNSETLSSVVNLKRSLREERENFRTFMNRLSSVAEGRWAKMLFNEDKHGDLMSSEKWTNRYLRHTGHLSDGASEREQKTNRKRRKHNLRRRLRKTLRQLLMDYTACPIHYTWRDWGPRFWPRWIKEGKCVDLGGTSCSVPPGMHCQEANHTRIVILRYICLANWPPANCNWYRVHMPILTECKCGCRTGRWNNTDVASGSEPKLKNSPPLTNMLPS